MIPPRELRLGNFFLNSSDSVQKVSTETLEYLVNPFMAPHEAVRPIILSPFILKAFGFIDPAENGFGLRIAIDHWTEICWYLQDGGNTLRFQSTGLDSGFTRTLDFFSVHQLQNFYFALTGKELDNVWGT